MGRPSQSETWHAVPGDSSAEPEWYASLSIHPASVGPHAGRKQSPEGEAGSCNL